MIINTIRYENFDLKTFPNKKLNEHLIIYYTSDISSGELKKIFDSIRPYYNENIHLTSENYLKREIEFIKDTYDEERINIRNKERLERIKKFNETPFDENESVYNRFLREDQHKEDLYGRSD